jgi:hypothetical protein
MREDLYAIHKLANRLTMRAPGDRQGGAWRSVLRARMRWYNAQTLSALRHSWQLIIWVVAVLPQMLSLHELTAPLAALSDRQLPVVRSAIGILLIYGFAMILVLSQRKAINGGEFQSYLRTLPIAPQIEWRTELVVLLFADTLIWLYLMLGFAQADGAVSERKFLFGQLFLLAASVLQVQRVMLLGRVLPAVGTALAATCLLLLVRRLPDPFATGTAIILGASCAAGMSGLKLLNLPIGKHGSPAGTPAPSTIRFLFARAPASRMILDHLFSEHRSYLLSRLLLSAAWTLLAALLLAHGAPREYGRGIIVLATGLAVLPLGGVFRTLVADRRDLDVYLASLPLRRGYWLVHEAACVIVMSLGTIMPFYGFFLAQHFLSLSTAFFILLLYVPLVAAICGIALWTSRHYLIWGQAAVAGWVTLMLWPT